MLKPFPHIYRSWRDVPADDWRWPSFSAEELACRGTGRVALDFAALDALQRLRNRLGKPIILNSAYRSPEHNARVGGAKASKHMEAIAFDCRMDNHDPAAFIAAAEASGFTGIGTYPRSGFVHIDTRDGHARWGDPFPARETPSFAPEPPREPETVSQDREAVGTVIGGGGVVAGGGAVLTGIGALDPVAQIVAIAGLVLALAALIYVFRRRLARLAR